MLLVLYVRTLCLTLGHRAFSPTFSSRSFIDLAITFRFMIPFEWLCVCVCVCEETVYIHLFGIWIYNCSSVTC